MVAKAKQPNKPPIQMNVDDQWLADYAEKVKSFGGTITEYEREDIADQADLSDVVEKQEEQVKKAVDSPLPKTKDQIKQDKELNAALQRGKQQARKEQALHKRAQKMDAASDERVAKEQEREREAQRKEAEEEEDEKRAKSIRDVRHVTQGINRALQNNVQPAIERAGTLPTYGGIGLMVGILLILLFIVIPVNAQGDTRLKQFWYMLNGRAKLQGAVSPQTGSQIVGGTPAPIGSIPGTQNQPAKCKSDPTKIIPLAPPTAVPDKDGCCPDGYSLVSLGLTGGQGNICMNNYNVALGNTSTPNNGSFRTSSNNLGF